MVRFFVHLVGDLHQPLHVITRATQKYPDGDKGGNLFKINFKPDDLHSLWDGVMNMIPAVTRPLDKTGVDAIESWANNIRNQYPRDSLVKELAVKDPWAIAKQIYQIAIDNAYGGIKEGDTPSENYLKTRFELCKKLMALSAYRLADYLNDRLKW